MIAANLDLDFVSRVALGLTCIFSCGAALALAIATHPKYTPHMILVSFWSFWAGAAMIDLAFPQLDFPLIPDRLLVINLNGAFIMAMGGWALFAARLWHEAVVSRRAETQVARAMQSALEAPRE